MRRSAERIRPGRPRPQTGAGPAARVRGGPPWPGLAGLLVLSLVSGCGLGAPGWSDLAGERTGRDGFAVLDGDRLVVGFPRVAPALPSWPSNRPGFGISAYEWRVATPGDGGLVANFGVRVSRDEDAPEYGSLRSVLDASTLRLCHPEGHVLTCRGPPLAAEAHEVDGRVVLVITDPALVGPLGSRRPGELILGVRMPGDVSSRATVPLEAPR